MEFNINKSDISEVLDIVRRTVPTKSIIPATKGILMEFVDGSLVMTSNNLEMSIQGIIENVVDNKIKDSIVLPEKFIDSVKSLPEQEVKIEKTIENTITVLSGKTKFTFYPIEAEEFLLFTPEEEWSKWSCIEFVDKDLKEILKRVVFATAKDISKMAFTGVLFYAENGILRCVASDTYRLASVELDMSEEELQPFKILVPGKSINELLRILGGEKLPVRCYIGEREIIFTYKQYIISMRLLEEKFPLSVERIFPQPPLTSLSVNLDMFSKALLRASVLSSGNATFSVNEDAIYIKVNEEIGSMDEIIDIELFSGEKLEEVIFNIRFLMDVFKIIDTEIVNIEFNGEAGPCIIKEINEKWEYKYLALPIKRR